MDPTKINGVDCQKLKNFDGSNFNACLCKVFFVMQLLKIHYVISEEKPNFEEDSGTEASWERDDHFCKSYLLNCLVDHLVDVYSNKPSVKDI